MPRIGVRSYALGIVPADEAKHTVGELEALGYGALWYPEGPCSKDAMAHGALLLSWTRRMLVAPGIASIYARDAVAARTGAFALAEAYPGRFALGLGVSHARVVRARGHRYAPPLDAMRAYLDAFEAAPYEGVVPEPMPPLLLAALAPPMIALARERADGVHTYLVPPEHTALAREQLGTGPLVVPDQVVLLERDATTGRELARRFLRIFLDLEHYRRNLRLLGFTEEDLAGTGSARLVDALVVHGEEAAIVGRVREHFAAGADAVSVQVLQQSWTEIPLEQYRRLAPALLELA